MILYIILKKKEKKKKKLVLVIIRALRVQLVLWNKIRTFEVIQTPEGMLFLNMRNQTLVSNVEEIFNI